MTAANPTPTRRPLPLLVLAGTVALAIALTALTGGSFASRTGYDQAARDVALSDWWTLWAIPPVEVALIALLLAVLLMHGRPERRPLAITTTALLLLAVCSPIAGLAQGGLLAAHMTQHVLVGGCASLLALLCLPRAIPGVATPRPWHRWVRPAPAFALWVVSTAVWLAPAVHHQVLVHQSLWIAQQVAFFVFGAIMWLPIVERITPAPMRFRTGAKAGYMTAVWMVGVTLANLFWFSGTAFYGEHAAAARAWGLTPLQDQGYAGTVMVVTHCALSFGAILVLFFREARERSLEQRLVEAGLPPERARWEVRYGDSAAAAAEVGIRLQMRAGID